MNKKLRTGIFAVIYILLLVGVFFLGRWIGKISTGNTETAETVADASADKNTDVTTEATTSSKDKEEKTKTDSTEESSDTAETSASKASEESAEEETTAESKSAVPFYTSSGAVDTGNLTSTGSGYEGIVGTGDFNYGEALQKAIIFYEEQRSGDLPDTGRVSWRGDSGLSDGSDNGVDLTGGLYDAGDNCKFNLPMAYTSSVLAWSVYENRDAYEESGQLEYILDTIKWVNDYLIKCHTEDEVFYYQVGDGNKDHSWWGPAEVMQMERPSYCVTKDSPGTLVVAQAAASLAACYVVYKDVDADYAATCLEHAKSLYKFGDETKSDAGYTQANGFYTDNSGFYDELTFAAIWLYIATDDETYLKAAEKYWAIEEHDYVWTLCWDDKSTGSALLLARLTGDKTYSTWLEKNLDYWTVGVDGQRVNYTSDGLAYLDSWGALRYATTEAFIAALYSEWDGCSADKAKTYMDFAESQVNYALGSTGYSYMVGFGDNYPQHVHHRTAQGSYCDNMNEPSTARHVLYGALVGGPTSSGSYPDSVADYSTSEVADDYNAGFVGILAIMYSKYHGQTLKDFGAVETPTEPELYIEDCVNVNGQDFLEVRSFVYNKTAYPARVTDNLKMKYFIDISEVYEAGGTVDNIVVTTNYVEGGSFSGIECVDEEKHIYAVVIDFAGTTIYPGGQSQYKKEVQFRIRCDLGVWDNSNDPSYVDLNGNNGSSLVTAAHMALYDGDELVFGEEP